MTFGVDWAPSELRADANDMPPNTNGITIKYFMNYLHAHAQTLNKMVTQKYKYYKRHNIVECKLFHLRHFGFSNEELSIFYLLLEKIQVLLDVYNCSGIPENYSSKF